jgi:pimeloyl-ACP methyl ester carboxylesterase
MSSIFKIFLSSVLFLLLGNNLALSQNLISFNFVDSGVTDGKTIRLEAFEYRPVNWNGKVILMSHGSTGGKAEVIKNTIKFLNISKEANASGYIFVTYMRKGRGNSEGSFTEESGRCDWANLSKEKKEAELQISQVIEQVKKNYSVAKVILMGHSRGGFLSATYAAKNPTNVSAVVNLAGAWSAICESKNGGLGRQELEDSAKKFKMQFWAYFEQDSYFRFNRFNDSDYVWLSKTAENNDLIFGRFSNQGMPDGHATPTYKPNEWARVFFPKLAAID